MAFGALRAVCTTGTSVDRKMYFATASLQKYVSEQRCHAQSMLLKGGAEDVKHDHTDL